MRRSRRSVFAFVLAASACALLSPSRADACTGACPVRRFAPTTDGAVVPASVRAFPVESMADGDLVLRDASGATVDGALAMSNGALVFRPTSPLASGRFTASWEATCAGAGAKVTTPLSFTVSAPVALPAIPGEMSVANAIRAPFMFPSVGGPANACTDELDVASVRVSVAPDPSLAPFDGVVVWQWSVDGSFAGNGMPWSYGASTHTLMGLCGGTTSIPGAFVALGTHDVEVRALVGDHVTETRKLRVRVSCGEKNGEVVPTDGPREVEPAPAASNGPDDTGGGETTSAGQEGCTVSRRTSTGPAGLLVITLGFVARILRRRARRA